MSSESSTIDCLLIGHNEMDFTEYESEIRKMGVHSGAYRDLNLEFVRYNNKLYTAGSMFNLFYMGHAAEAGDADCRPLGLGETFSAAIAYLGSYLDRRGLSFDYVNNFQEGREKLERLLSGDGVLTVGIITTLYVSVFPILEIMEFVRRHNRDVRVILGGPFVATQCRTMEAASLEYLFNSIGADAYVNNSQGEATLVEVIKAYQSGAPLSGIKNIHYKTEEGYVATDFCEENNDLSKNMVNWDLFAGDVGPFASLRTSISCPFSCAFCGFPEHAGEYRTADLDAIEEELNGLSRLRELKSINFIDDTFNVPKKRFKDILEMMIRKGYQYKWNSHYRCQFADEESVELMKRSGCEGVFLGIESGSDTILKNMNKAATVAQFYRGIELLKKAGILTYGSFIIGFPGETEDTVAETVKFIKESGLDFYRVQLWYCETITPIWRQREKYGLGGSNFEWSHATMDSRRACDIVDEIFMTVEDPVWVPKFNFEFGALFQLMHRGFKMEQVLEYIKYFNAGIKEKLSNPSRREISMDVARRLKAACALDTARTADRAGTNATAPKTTNQKVNRSSVDFDF